MNEQTRIKQKILSINPKRWWGDDFDVRYYLISKLKNFKNKIIVDIGGGIGIISSEMDNSNMKINLDSSIEDLKACMKNFPEINVICGSMEKLPFKNSIFDVVILSNVLEVDKSKADLILHEACLCTNASGKTFVTTPNNAYYNSIKLEYDELKSILSSLNYRILFFNSHRKLAKHRKLNLANVIPKLKSRIENPDKIIESLAHDYSRNNYSVSFYVEISR